MEFDSRHVSEFSPDGKLFALISQQGIVKIWNTETNELKQEFTPNLHLADPCTCLTWVTISSSQTGQDKRKTTRATNESRRDGSDQLYLALGTSKGGVTMYSYSMAKVERRFKGEGHSGRINSIIYDGSNLLCTVGDDCNVVVWIISDEVMKESWSVGNEKPHSILFLPKSKNVLIGGRQLRLFSPNSSELIQTFTGHASEVILLSYFIHNFVEYALSASKMERIICLWTLSNRKKNQTSTCTFLMEDIAYCLCCKVDSENNVKVAAVTRSGVIHIYLNSMEKITPAKPIKPDVTIQIVSDISSVITPIPAINASLQHANKGKDILFGYGDIHFLHFEDIALNYGEKLQILTRGDPKKLNLKSSKERNKNAPKTISPIVASNDVEYSTATAVSHKRIKDVQMPMETRLQNLLLENGEFPTIESKVQLLIQSLHSKDETLLTSVLSTADTKIIQRTLEKLPAHYISPLVNELTLLFNKKRNNIRIACNWLSILVKTHSSQLMVLDINDLLNKFGPCLGIIEHRSNSLPELSKLHARLQLTLNKFQQSKEVYTLNNDNVLVYEDRDSPSSDMEGLFVEESWEILDEDMDKVKENME